VAFSHCQVVDFLQQRFGGIVQRKTWVTIGFISGAALAIGGIFTPGPFSADGGLVWVAPSFHMMTAGVMILIITTILRKPKPAEGAKSKRSAGLAWTGGCGGLLLIMFSLSAWYWVFLIWGVIGALPIAGLVAIVWAIAKAAAKRQAKDEEKSNPEI
jgi:hypothetical protein